MNIPDEYFLEREVVFDPDEFRLQYRKVDTPPDICRMHPKLYKNWKRLLKQIRYNNRKNRNI